jgi:hypothetical protein
VFVSQQENRRARFKRLARQCGWRTDEFDVLHVWGLLWLVCAVGFVEGGVCVVVVGLQEKKTGAVPGRPK